MTNEYRTAQLVNAEKESQEARSRYETASDDLDCYTLIEDGRIVSSVTSTFLSAMDLARELSKDGTKYRRVVNGTMHTGSLIVIWSGPVAPRSASSAVMCGITKHAAFACGFPF